MQITTQQINDLKKPRVKADIISVLQDRFSPRVYLEDKINKENLNKIIEAARWAPSAMNNQPWFFFIAKKGSKGFEKLTNCLGERNYWAKKAPVLILACYLKEDSWGDYGQYDLGQAVFSLVIQARSLGFHSRQIAAFDKEKIKNDLKLEGNFFPWVIVALGKIGDYTKADQVLIGKDNLARQRKENIMKEI